MNKPEVKPILMRCFAVSDAQLGNALAGRLLTVANESKPDHDPLQWQYRAGFAAGVRWACELATSEDLHNLDADNALPWLIVPAWLRGFIDGALSSGKDTASSAGCNAA